MDTTTATLRLGLTKPLIIFTMPTHLSATELAKTIESIQPKADLCGFEFLVLHGGVSVAAFGG